ncbi:unnamed protein product [Rotaria sp. Silwood2]|nr:unnamed protein product [Rotaria sp. Silwood2]CAF3934061.1 unnamed protein product [Rotaria sp. Silwood2]
MGNAKCTPIGEDITAANTKRTHQNINETTKSSEIKKETKRVQLSDRDIAFLCAQTGNIVDRARQPERIRTFQICA